MDKEKIQVDFQIDAQVIADQIMARLRWRGASQTKTVSIIIRSWDHFFAKPFGSDPNVWFVLAIDEL